MIPPAKSRRGFASMDPDRLRQIASEGGKRAHVLGLAHQWTPEEAREAGAKGAHVRWRQGVAARAAKAEAAR